jgi:hypothetical protein
MQVHVPSRTEHTSVRPGCDGKLDTPPTSTWGCCTWQALVGPPIYRPKRSLGEERFSGSREWGMIISSSSTSSSFSPEDSNSEEVSPSPPPPPCLCDSPDNTFEPFFLFLHGPPLIFGVVGLLPCHILRQGDPSHVVVHTSKTLQHERSRQKRQKLTQSCKNRPEHTHPGAGDPVPQGNQSRAGASVCLESKDPLDLGINLHIR